MRDALGILMRNGRTRAALILRGVRNCAPSIINVRHRSLAYIRRVFDERDVNWLRHCYLWRSQGESSLERARIEIALGPTPDFIRSRLVLYSILHSLRGDQADGIRTRDTEFASFSASDQRHGGLFAARLRLPQKAEAVPRLDRLRPSGYEPDEFGSTRDRHEGLRVRATASVSHQKRTE